VACLHVERNQLSGLLLFSYYIDDYSTSDLFLLVLCVT
jgi:hypothetical protein